MTTKWEFQLELNAASFHNLFPQLKAVLSINDKSLNGE